MVTEPQTQIPWPQASTMGGGSPRLTRDFLYIVIFKRMHVLGKYGHLHFRDAKMEAPPRTSYLPRATQKVHSGDCVRTLISWFSQLLYPSECGGGEGAAGSLSQGQG